MTREELIEAESSVRALREEREKLSVERIVLRDAIVSLSKQILKIEQSMPPKSKRGRLRGDGEVAHMTIAPAQVAVKQKS